MSDYNGGASKVAVCPECWGQHGRQDCPGDPVKRNLEMIERHLGRRIELTEREIEHARHLQRLIDAGDPSMRPVGRLANGKLIRFADEEPECEP